MSDDINPRANILSTTEGDPVPFREPYFVELSDTGKVRVFCGNLVMVGSTDDDDGPRSVSLVVGQRPCDCGCKMPGRAIEYVPTPDQARMLASQLIEAADAVDAVATKHAAGLFDRLRKASGR